MQIKKTYIVEDEGELNFGLSNFKFSRLLVEFDDGRTMQIQSESKSSGSINTLKRAKQRFEKLNKKYHCSYAGFIGGEIKGDIIKFAQYIKDNSYNYRDGQIRQFAPKKAIYEYSGNLEKISNAFSFYIFDKSIADEVSRISGVQITARK